LRAQTPFSSCRDGGRERTPPADVGLFGGAEESSVAQAQALFGVNVFGVLRVTNAVLPTMRRQGKGRIVNLGSAHGIIPAPMEF
jgi:short-subunit dehydrogenase